MSSAKSSIRNSRILKLGEVPKEMGLAGTSSPSGFAACNQVPLISLHAIYSYVSCLADQENELIRSKKDSSQTVMSRKRCASEAIISPSNCSIALVFFWPTLAGSFILCERNDTPLDLKSENLIPAVSTACRKVLNTAIRKTSSVPTVFDHDEAQVKPATQLKQMICFWFAPHFSLQSKSEPTDYIQNGFRLHSPVIYTSLSWFPRMISLVISGAGGVSSSRISRTSDMVIF
uniref:Uncharacterized protein n=1 Tax=Timema bartmani TaxID=61472 RepID=A0A7R9I669_9NEOP|nr:unnamed protein product [Timema bartmani]